MSETDRRIWFVGQVPVAEYDVPSALAMAERRRVDKAMLRPFVETHNSQNRRVSEVLAVLSKEYTFEVIDPQNVLCDGSRCDIQRTNRPLYRDNHHLSTHGARQLLPLLEPIFIERQRDGSGPDFSGPSGSNPGPTG